MIATDLGDDDAGEVEDEAGGESGMSARRTPLEALRTNISLSESSPSQLLEKRGPRRALSKYAEVDCEWRRFD